MNLKSSLFAVVVMLLAAGIIFQFFQRRLSGPLLAMGAHPEVLELLEESLDDQRQLAKGDPEKRAAYRRRFDDTVTLVQRLRILELSRADIARRYEQLLLFFFAGTVLLVTGGVVVRQSRHENRLSRLRTALADLAGGRTDIEIGDRRRDTIGRIATMIERTSRIMARDRRRLASMKNLSAWQESARRHAHEMRTPLTGARLELTRLDTLLEAEPLSRPDEVREATRSVTSELERLGHFTRAFTSFARVPRPQLAVRDLAQLVEEFVTTFESAWPNLELRFAAPAGGVEAAIDREMVRQVLVNLCDNSSLALGKRRGTVTLRLTAAADTTLLDIADDGPGVDDSVRSRLFEPYTTSRSIGEGMGLGLAISKKILLDHDGDLELLETSPAGTTFRLTFNRRIPEPVARATPPETVSPETVSPETVSLEKTP